MSEAPDPRRMQEALQVLMEPCGPLRERIHAKVAATPELEWVSPIDQAAVDVTARMDGEEWSVDVADFVAHVAVQDVATESADEARWFVRSLEQRGVVLRRIAAALAAAGAFDDEGVSVNAQRLGDELGMHRSTIERAARDKTVRLPAGDRPLAQFVA